MDTGSRYAVYQIIKYIIMVIGITLGLESIGVDITIFIAGSAALLVGIGLGLQQVFLDLIAGIIILFERKLKVGDIIEVDNKKGTIRSIDIRTSQIITKEGLIYLIPNSKFLTNAVVNWSHETQGVIEYGVKVTVANGTDIAKAVELLKDIAVKHTGVADTPGPQVRMVDFNERGIVLQIEFFSADRQNVGDIQSDIRFEIEQQFKANNIHMVFARETIISNAPTH